MVIAEREIADRFQMKSVIAFVKIHSLGGKVERLRRRTNERLRSLSII